MMRSTFDVFELLKTVPLPHDNHGPRYTPTYASPHAPVAQTSQTSVSPHEPPSPGSQTLPACAAGASLFFETNAETLTRASARGAVVFSVIAEAYVAEPSSRPTGSGGDQ